MTEAARHETIDIADLRVGMYIHLQGGWLAHPFPLSRFRLSSAQQIATLRRLGLTRIAWNPARSDPAFRTDAAAPPGVPRAPAAPSGDEDDDEAARQRARREARAIRQADLERCEQQFAEATAACSALTGSIARRPKAAGRQAAALSRAFVEKMIADGDSCIRLLAEGAGDPDSMHAVNVTVLSLLLARAFGVGDGELVDLGTGALLHDVGTLDLPERLRHHDERFGAADSAAWQRHVEHGVAQARRMELSATAEQIVAQHHEQADGSGFPAGLAGNGIAVGARIVALVDRYDRLCNPPLATASALTPHEALALMFTREHSRHDALLLAGLVRLLGVYPPGSTVQLTDDRYAMVVVVDPRQPLRPRLRVYDPALPADELLSLDLRAQPELGIRRSVRPRSLPGGVLERLSPRTRMAFYFEPAPAVERREAAAA